MQENNLIIFIDFPFHLCESTSMNTDLDGSPHGSPDTTGGQAEVIAQLRRVIFDPRDPLGEFERIGDWYYQETGFLRPGKSEPIETGRSSNDPENRQRFSDWYDSKRIAAIDAANLNPVASDTTTN